MSLTPKHWAEFQHYKDRAPSWIKLHRKLLDDFAFHRLPVASRALAPMLWLLASEYEGGGITASVEEMSYRLRMSEKDFGDALKPLIDSGFFIDASGVLADRYQDAIPEKEKRERKRREREDSCAVASATRTDAEKFFDEFWGVYPKRGKAANPRKPAKDKFLRLLKAGSDARAIIESARRYRDIEIERGAAGTDKVAQAITWLNQERWADYLPQSESKEPEWKPPAGAPSREELLKRYGGQSGERTDVRERGEGTEGRGAGVLRESSECAEGGTLRIQGGGGRVGPMQSMGAILHRSLALDAGRLSGVPDQEHGEDGRSDGMAAVVRSELH